MGTAAISAMAIGIGADYAVYFMFRVREEFERTGDLRAGDADRADHVRQGDRLRRQRRRGRLSLPGAVAVQGARAAGRARGPDHGHQQRRDGGVPAVGDPAGQAALPAARASGTTRRPRSPDPRRRLRCGAASVTAASCGIVLVGRADGAAVAVVGLAGRSLLGGVLGRAAGLAWRRPGSRRRRSWPCPRPCPPRPWSRRRPCRAMSLCLASRVLRRIGRRLVGRARRRVSSARTTGAAAPMPSETTPARPNRISFLSM